MPTITAILTVHNRREKTLECLRAFFGSVLLGPKCLSAVMVDDGCSDGTAEAVAEALPEVAIERGDGSLFWNRGMGVAQQVAEKSHPDFLLWLNDDTRLATDALSKLLATYTLAKDNGAETMVVGATVDPISGELTYGGLVSVSPLRRFTFRKLAISDAAQQCEAMNGNIVLVPKSIYMSVGGLDSTFEHALGDIDYALRVRAAGFLVAVAPGAQGTCSGNAIEGTYLDPKLPANVRWQQFRGKKGLPRASWRHFVRRHAGSSWLLFYYYPYAKFILRVAVSRLLRSTGVRHE